MRKIVYLLTGLFASVGLALAGALPAGAAQVGSCTTSTLQYCSNHLAGHVMQGNGIQTFGNIQGTLTPPAEPNIPVLVNRVGQGFALAQNVSTGGAVYGIAPVFDSTSPTAWDDGVLTLIGSISGYVPCLPGQWTVEAGNESSNPAPAPVDTNHLHPLIFFGEPICLNGGQSEFVRIYHSTAAGIVYFLAGPSAADNDVLLEDHGVFTRFRAAAEGITTTDGFAAAALTLGNSFVFGPVTVQVLADGAPGAPSHNVAFGSGGTNYSTFEGTQFGTAPSVSNPVTLTPVWTGPGSANAVLVP